LKLSWPGGSLDLSSYTRVSPDDQSPVDPYSPHFEEPTFAQTPYSDGQALTSVTVNNREQGWPLYLKDSSYTKDAVHALVRVMNNALRQRPLTLEWRDDGASASTFYEIPFARFEPSFNFRRSQHGYVAGVLHTWTSGYGHTGTTRVTATAAGTGVFLSVPIASIAGDAPALLDTTVNAGAVVPSLGRVVALAPISQPSYAAQVPAASLTDLQAGASLVGASGYDGSQYLALPVAPTGGASGIACKVPLPNPTIAGGDNRILALVKSGIDAGIGLYALDPYGNQMGGTAVASNSQGVALVDLGVCRLPTVGFPTLPKISIYAGAIWASGAAGPAILSSPAGLALNEVICLPERDLTLLYERTAVVSNAGLAASALSLDSFPAANAALSGQNDGVGNPWSEAWNNAPSPGLFRLLESGGLLFLNSNASIMDSAHLAGLLSPNMQVSAKPLFQVKGGDVRLIKESATGVYLQGRLTASSYVLDLAAATNGTLNTLGSLALATLTLNQKYRLALNVNGQAAYLSLTSDSGGPVFIPGSAAFASVGVSLSAAVSAAGVPAIAIANPSTNNQAAFSPNVFSWEVDTIAVPGTSSASSIGLQAYDSYHLDGPHSDSWRQSSAGAFSGYKLTSVQRGAFPKISPSAVSLAVVCAPVDQGPGNDLISAVVKVRERFSYGQ
jgi:hypothetical protein